MIEDVKAPHARGFYGTDLPEHQHGESADRKRQLWVVIGASDGSFVGGSLEFPTAAVPRTQVVYDFEGKGALYMVAPLGKGALNIDDASEYAIA
jgi:hypothetical protein